MTTDDILSGLVEIDSHRYYTRIWVKIRAEVDPIDDNWEEVKRCKKAGIPPPVLILPWGIKHPATGEKTILAVCQSVAGEPDRHWVTPELFAAAMTSESSEAI